jgi:hypothetical protein
MGFSRDLDRDIIGLTFGVIPWCGDRDLAGCVRVGE